MAGLVPAIYVLKDVDARAKRRHDGLLFARQMLYLPGMPDWVDHPHTAYMLAAYGVAAFMLLALLFASWRSLERRQAEWKKLRSQSPGSVPH
jgi:hypothetical protein